MFPGLADRAPQLDLGQCGLAAGQRPLRGHRRLGDVLGDVDLRGDGLGVLVFACHQPCDREYLLGMPSLVEADAGNLRHTVDRKSDDLRGQRSLRGPGGVELHRPGVLREPAGDAPA